MLRPRMLSFEGAFRKSNLTLGTRGLNSINRYTILPRLFVCF